MYQVIGKDGQVSEPMHVSALQNMVEARQLDPQQMLIDPISGQTLPAVQMLDGRVIFPPPMAVIPTPMSIPMQTIQVPVPDTSLLGLRVGGYVIDLLCSIPLLIPALIPFVGILFAPLLGLYWVSRDAFFGGQSIGKKAMGLKVVRLDGKPVDWGTSVQRNIVFLPLLLTAIPGIGLVLGPTILVLINVIEILLVLTTQRRIGDNIAKTVVVKA
jgi:uncharacterized RDD family membrane protein YckC